MGTIVWRGVEKSSMSLCKVTFIFHRSLAPRSLTPSRRRGAPGWLRGRMKDAFLYPRGGASLPEGSGPLLVISVVGGESSDPVAVANRLADLPAFCAQDFTALRCTSHVSMHLDSEHRILYLSMSAAFQTQALLDELESLPTGASSSSQSVHLWLTQKSNERVRCCPRT